MPKYRICVHDRLTHKLMHEVSHVVYARSRYEALTDVVKCYGFKKRDWELIAREIPLTNSEDHHEKST